MSLRQNFLHSVVLASTLCVGQDSLIFQIADIALPQVRRRNASSSDSDGDTDDEIQRIQARRQQQTLGKGGASDDDEYGGSTDVGSEEETTDTRLLPSQSSEVKPHTNLLDLPSFFSKHHFLLYGNFDTTERKQLTRYVTAFDG